jgi:hypothetical protein
MGVPCSFDDFTFESGQILIDKMGNNGLNLAALWIASGMLDDRCVRTKVRSAKQSPATSGSLYVTETRMPFGANIVTRALS